MKTAKRRKGARQKPRPFLYSKTDTLFVSARIRAAPRANARGNDRSPAGQAPTQLAVSDTGARKGPRLQNRENFTRKPTVCAARRRPIRREPTGARYGASRPAHAARADRRTRRKPTGARGAGEHVPAVHAARGEHVPAVRTRGRANNAARIGVPHGARAMPRAYIDARCGTRQRTRRGAAAEVFLLSRIAESRSTAENRDAAHKKCRGRVTEKTGAHNALRLRPPTAFRRSGRRNGTRAMPRRAERPAR